MTEEQLKDLASLAGDDRIIVPFRMKDISELASALLAAQARVAELEQENTRLMDKLNMTRRLK